MGYRAGLCAALISAMAPGISLAEPHGYFGAIGCAYGLKTKGCSTSYEEGATVLRLAETTARVSARGNGRTSRQTVLRYAMRKAAETAISAGYEGFDVLQMRDVSLNWTGVSGNGTTYGSYAVSEPGLEMTISFLHAPLATDGLKIFDAKSVLQLMDAPK